MTIYITRREITRSALSRDEVIGLLLDAPGTEKAEVVLEEQDDAELALRLRSYFESYDDLAFNEALVRLTDKASSYDDEWDFTGLPRQRKGSE